MNRLLIIFLPLLFATLLLFDCQLVKGQSATEAIRLNQIGFYPKSTKIAVLVVDSGSTAQPKTFQIATSDRKKIVFTGKLGETRKAGSGKTTRLADFSAFQKSGTYVVTIPEIGQSYSFRIEPNIHRNVAIGALRGFYYQRVSTELPEKYAGKWHRPAGHPDTHVLIHPSAASATRPAGTTISSPRGWYDAGDYNKYIVNSGITVATLLSLYEDHPAYFTTFSTNIPETGNAIPDLLDEVLWNLRWMHTMQDPADGGVYHKLTNARFDGMVMPHKATNDRYVVQKSVTAALDFAAVMAQASRVLRAFNKDLPDLADSCQTAAVKAWQWAKQHPDALYRQNEMNTQFDPDVVTGDYGDRSANDEWIWAAAELYTTTKEDKYLADTKLIPDEKMPLPSWNQVRLLGYYTLARFADQLTPASKKDVDQIKKQLVEFSNKLLDGVDKQPYGTVMGCSASDYIWGSSSVAANQGIALLQAYRLTKDARYLQRAIGNLDYLLGRNATGYCFLTDFGHRQVMHPHHRPSEADNVAEPVPGLLSGGPNGNAPRQDKCPGYRATSPDETFIDATCSYASNEIAINWNAPMVYLAAALEALQTK
ncbi:glycoside hydrolase family 9 protein [Spirosoma daeguense]